MNRDQLKEQFYNESGRYPHQDLDGYIHWLEDAMIRHNEAKQAKPDFTDFGGFDPKRPWANDWAKYRAVDANGNEYEYERKPQKDHSCLEYCVFGRFGLIRRHDMTGKDWTKSKQEKNR